MGQAESYRFEEVGNFPWIKSIWNFKLRQSVKYGFLEHGLKQSGQRFENSSDLSNCTVVHNDWGQIILETFLDIRLSRVSWNTVCKDPMWHCIGCEYDQARQLTHPEDSHSLAQKIPHGITPLMSSIKPSEQCFHQDQVFFSHHSCLTQILILSKHYPATCRGWWPRKLKKTLIRGYKFSKGSSSRLFHRLTSRSDTHLPG